jgi:ADP-heptose:LPS heptosyltransferase
MNPRVIMAPYSNSRTRDWPVGHMRQLAILCVERMDAIVEFVGTRAQRHGVNAMVRTLPADRYINRCGVLTWEQTGSLIRAAACVVANNSGIGHFAAELGVPVVSLFGATHSPLEWMPRGPHVSVMVRHTACVQCGITGESVADCPHQLRCLTDITPSDAFAEMRRLMRQRQSEHQLA